MLRYQAVTKRGLPYVPLPDPDDHGGPDVTVEVEVEQPPDPPVDQSAEIVRLLTEQAERTARLEARLQDALDTGWRAQETAEQAERTAEEAEHTAEVAVEVAVTAAEEIAETVEEVADELTELEPVEEVVAPIVVENDAPPRREHWFWRWPDSWFGGGNF